LAKNVPKPIEQRRNRNPKQAGDWILLPEGGRKDRAPSCAGYGFSKTTQAWWRGIWRSPMATQWTEDDIPYLAELGILRERLLDGKTSVASEVRIRSNEFGLSPAGRQSRRWMITEKDQERAEYKKPGTVTKLRVAMDRRTRPQGTSSW